MCRRPVARRRPGTRCPRRGSPGQRVRVDWRRRRRRCRGRRRDGRARPGARRAGVRGLDGREHGRSRRRRPPQDRSPRSPWRRRATRSFPRSSAQPTAVAGQLVGDELRQHQQSRRSLELGPVVGGELEDRVDRHQLHARSPVELGLTQRPRHGAPAIRAWAPVAVRVGEQPPLLVEQAVVDRPAVDSDRVNGSCLERAVETEADVLEELRPAPPHRAVRTRAPGRAANGGRPRVAAPRRRARRPRRGPTSRPCRRPRRASLPNPVATCPEPRAPTTASR